MISRRASIQFHVSVIPRIVAVQKYIFPSPRKVLVETCRHFNQRRKASVHDHATLGWLHYPAKDLQRGAFPGTIVTDDTECFSRA